MQFKQVSFLAGIVWQLRAILARETGTLTFTKIKDVISNVGLRGIKVKIVDITFDAAYVNGTGYTVTAANVGLKNKILSLASINVAGYQIAVTYSGNDAVLKAFKGNTEASTNESGLNTLVGRTVVWGY